MLQQKGLIESGIQKYLLKHGQRCLNSVNYFFFVSHNVRNYFLSAIGVKISGDIAGPDWKLTLVVF